MGLEPGVSLIRSWNTPNKVYLDNLGCCHHPLVLITFWMGWRLWGMQPMGFHNSKVSSTGANYNY